MTSLLQLSHSSDLLVLLFLPLLPTKRGRIYCNRMFLHGLATKNLLCDHRTIVGPLLDRHRPFGRTRRVVLLLGRVGSIVIVTRPYVMRHNSRPRRLRLQIGRLLSLLSTILRLYRPPMNRMVHLS